MSCVRACGQSLCRCLYFWVCCCCCSVVVIVAVAAAVAAIIDGMVYLGGQFRGGEVKLGWVLGVEICCC